MMISKHFQRLLVVAVLALLSLSSSQAQQKDNLPSMGATGVIPVGQEYYMGRAWLMSYRRQVPIVEDPLMQVYLETLIFELAEKSELTDHRLVIVAVKNSTINAFAVPGGWWVCTPA
jgi:predicted Zn-dependent protease